MARSGRRSGRAAAKKAAATIRTPRKQAIKDEDVAMADAELSDEEAQPDEDEDEENANGVDEVEDAEDEAQEEEQNEDGDEEDNDDDNDNDNDNGDEEEEQGEEEEVADEEQVDAGNESEQSARVPTPPPEPVIRKKRVGRPPKIRSELDSPARTDAEATPRRRGRGGWRGRGGRKGATAPTKPTQAIDKEGTLADVLDDECVLPEDAEGETKVDKLGNLQGGREYRCRTFTVHGRGERLYMLSTEPARCVGFRDSYLFFTKHLRLYKIIANDEEKKDMIEREIIPHSYKGRAIGVVTARSVFREFGARMIVGGRRITDDYNVADARAEGAVEGEIADPTDKFVEGQPYNKNQYVAWHGASSVYHQAAPAQPAGPAKVESKKRRVNVNDTNWMLEHSREASVFNSRLSAIRAGNLVGLYDIHTNTMQVPSHMQPTRAVFEPVLPSSSKSSSSSSPRDDAATPNDTPTTTTTMFPPPDPKVTRNYLVLDTHYRSPPSGIASAAYEPPNPADILAPFRGLAAVSDEIKDLLPPECRVAFDDALAQETAWREQWDEAKAREAETRRPLIIDRTVQPYSVPLRDL